MNIGNACEIPLTTEETYIDYVNVKAGAGANAILAQASLTISKLEITKSLSSIRANYVENLKSRHKAIRTAANRALDARVAEEASARYSRIARARNRKPA